MTLHVVLDRDLSQDIRAQIEELSVECFGAEVLDLAKTLYFSRTFKHIYYEINGEIVAYLRVIRRETSWNNEPLLIGGIGAVMTREKYRGKGYAGKLLQEAKKVLKEEKVDIGLLQTNIKLGQRLYGQIGFIPAGVSYRFYDFKQELHEVKSKGVMMCPVSSPHKLEDILHSSEVLNIGAGDW